MKGLYSVRHVADHEVIPYLLHFTARRDARRKSPSSKTEIWIVGNPNQWFTKTQLNWSYTPNSYTLLALLGIGIVLGAAITLNGYTMGAAGASWTGFFVGLGITLGCLLLMIISSVRQKKPVEAPRSLSERDSVRVVNPAVAASSSWFELVRAVDRFVTILRAEDHEYDQLSSKIYRELKRALWEAASVTEDTLPHYLETVLPGRGRDAAALVDAYASSLQPAPATQPA